MLNCFVVGCGGFLGSVARYLMGMISIPRHMTEKDRPRKKNWKREYE